MNLYEHEGKSLLNKYGIQVPKSVLITKNDSALDKYKELGLQDVVLKVQILSGKRGKNNGIKFCKNGQEVIEGVSELFQLNIKGQHVDSVLMEELLIIEKEHYLSCTYDTTTKLPMLMYSQQGGVEVEDVGHELMFTQPLSLIGKNNFKIDDIKHGEALNNIAEQLYDCFLKEDARVAEINPLVQLQDGTFIAADAKIALDDDGMYRHKDRTYSARTMMGRLPTDREIAASEIDGGEKYYRGTAGKYIDMDGDIAVIFSGGGASIAAMDALINAGFKPANYTEYSGNPPKEKVYELTKIVLSKPNIKALWMAGAVANSTDVAATFQGIVDAFDEVGMKLPVVIRRAGPNDKEGMRIMQECADRNGFKLKMFGKEVGIDDTVEELVKLVEGL